MRAPGKTAGYRPGCRPGYRSVLAWAAVGLALFATPLALAQSLGAGVAVRFDPDGVPIPVKLTIAPTAVTAGTPVTLKGSSTGIGAANTVKLVVTPPFNAGAKPAPETMAATINSAGDYSLSYTKTQRDGTYTVVATAPDGRGEARAVFAVYSPGGVGNAVTATIDEGMQQAEEHLAMAAQKLESLPNSPAKNEAKQKIAKLKQDLARHKTSIQGMKPVIKRIVDPPKTKDPKRDATIEKYKAAFLEQDRASREHLKRSKTELDSMRGQYTTCDSIEVVTEGLKWTSFMLNFVVKGPMDLAESLTSELLGTVAGRKVQDATGSELLGLGANELTQNLKVFQEKKIERANLLAAITDVGAYASQKVMDAFCESFTGPVSGTMDAKFFNGGQQWWTYEYKIAGRIVMHYPKAASGSKVTLKGHIEGYAYDFHMWENSLSINYPGLMSSAVQVKKVIPPFDAGAAMANGASAYDEGSVAGAILPNSFFVGVVGYATKDELFVQLDSARTDIKASATVIAVVLSPLAMLPQVISYDLPYKDVRFMIERGVGAETFSIPLITGKSNISGKKSFANTKGGSEARANYTFKVEACNPGCETGPSAAPKAKP